MVITNQDSKRDSVAASIGRENLHAADLILEVSALTVEFGGIRALDNASFGVKKGEICGLIGPNGAGKTTLFNCISRIYEPTKGKILFNGENLLKVQRDTIAERGIARTFQNIGLYPSLTIIENVVVGAQSRISGRFFDFMLGTPKNAQQERRLFEEAFDILSHLALHGDAHRYPKELPFGSLKRVELARALMANPKLLLLDEPANGLSHGEVKELSNLILKIQKEKNLSIVLVEHHMGMVRAVTDHVVVLDVGRKISEGRPEYVQNDKVVIEAYLGRAN